MEVIETFLENYDLAPSLYLVSVTIIGCCLIVALREFGLWFFRVNELTREITNLKRQQQHLQEKLQSLLLNQIDEPELNSELEADFSNDQIIDGVNVDKLRQTIKSQMTSPSN